MAYLLDADVFIRAKNQHYGFNFCPAFWDWLTRENAAKKVFSIEKVGDEIQALTDELSAWAGNCGPDFFLPPNASTLPYLSQVSTWAYGQNYTPAAINGFLQVADYYLVAQALSGNHTVVTHEVAAGSLKKIKIPDACISLGVKCVNPFEMLRLEKARFVLGT